MIKKEDDYIRLYKELINRINQKEDVIEKMTRYIVKNAKKNNNMCKRKGICSEKNCMICVREYFDKS